MPAIPSPPLAANSTTSESLTVDGFLLNTLAYNISTGSGRAQSPAIRGTNAQLAGRHGEIYVPMKTMDVGTFTLSMWIAGCNPDGTIPTSVNLQRIQFLTSRDKLIQLFTKRYALLHFAQIMPDFSVRECYGDVLEIVDFSSMAGRTRADFNVAVRVPDVYWQDASVTTQGFTNMTFSSSTTTQTFSSFTPSTGYISDSVVTVTGPITNPVIADAASGISVSLLGTAVPAGQTWVVDSSQWASTLNSVSVLANTTHSGSNRFLEITPTDPPSLTLTGTGTTSATGLQLTARNKYVAA